MSSIQKKVVDDLKNLNEIALNQFRTKGSEYSNNDMVNNDDNCEISEAFPKLTASKFFKFLYSIKLFAEK